MKSILIVDDNDSVAEMFAYLFAGHEWRVTWYSGGERACEALGGESTTTRCSWGTDSRASTAWT